MRALAAFLIFVAIIAVYEGADRQFKIKNIYFSDLSQIPAEIDEFPENTPKMIPEQVFSQTFTYLDRGKQSFVFLSQDGKYVLKFFDSRVLQPRLLSFGSAKSLKRKKSRLFNGYQLAFTHNRDNTGLVFYHVPHGPDQGGWPVATVIDRFGFTHHIDLKAVPFALQHKAVPAREIITSLLEQGKLDETKFYLNEILELYLSEYKRGICDRDHNFMYNTGFLDQRAIRLDAGRLYANECIKDTSVYLSDLKKIAIGRLGGWTERHFPQYREELLSYMHAKLEKIEKELSK